MDTYKQSCACNKLKCRDRGILGYNFLTMMVCLIKLVKIKSSALSRNHKTLQAIIAKTQSNKISFNPVALL